jgi:ferric-dicitrate binding protein FerR (iron transport regulator)
LAEVEARRVADEARQRAEQEARKENAAIDHEAACRQTEEEAPKESGRSEQSSPTRRRLLGWGGVVLVAALAGVYGWRPTHRVSVVSSRVVELTPGKEGRVGGCCPGGLGRRSVDGVLLDPAWGVPHGESGL